MGTDKIRARRYTTERMKTLQAEVGRLIRQAANEAGLTLKELSEKLGVSRPTIYAYASGQLRISESRLAQIARITGKPVEYFRSALTGTIADRLDGEASIELLNALLEPPNPQRASELAVTLIGVNRSHKDDLHLAELQKRAGNALLLQGDYVAAAHQLEQARELFQKLGLKEKAARCSQSLGYCYINLGQLDKAESSFEHSRDFSSPEDRWRGEVSLAALAERVGDLPEAARLLDAIAEQPGLPAVAKAYVLANRASLHAARGSWKAALPACDEALKAATANRLHDQVIELFIQSSLACLSTGKYRAAFCRISRALDIAFGAQDDARRTLARLVYARLLWRMGRLVEARAITSQALGTATRNQYRRSEAAGLIQLAEIALARGDNEQARDYAVQASAFAASHDYPVIAAVAQSLHGLASARLGDVDSAECSAEQALSECRSAELGEGMVLALWSAARSAEAIRDLSRAQARYDEAIAIAVTEGLKPLEADLCGEAIAVFAGKARDSLEARRSRVSAEIESEKRMTAEIMEGAGIAPAQGDS